MYRIILKPETAKDIEHAYNWYEDQQNGLGDRFLETLKECYKKLEQYPFSFSEMAKSIRQLKLKTFPYVIVFEVIQHEVVIYAVFHTSQHLVKKFKKR